MAGRLGRIPAGRCLPRYQALVQGWAACWHARCCVCCQAPQSCMCVMHSSGTPPTTPRSAPGRERAHSPVHCDVMEKVYLAKRCMQARALAVCDTTQRHRGRGAHRPSCSFTTASPWMIPCIVAYTLLGVCRQALHYCMRKVACPRFISHQASQCTRLQLGAPCWCTVRHHRKMNLRHRQTHARPLA